MLSWSHPVSQWSCPRTVSVRLLVSCFDRLAFPECTDPHGPEWRKILQQRSRGVAMSRVGGPHGADRWWRRSGRRGPPSSKCLWLWRMCPNLFAILRRRGLPCPPSRVNTACPLWFSFGLCSHLRSGYWNQLHSHSLNKEKCTQTDELEGTRLLWILPPTSRSSLGCLGTVVISLDRKLDCSKRSLGDE